MAFDYTSGNPNNLTGASPAAMTDIQGPFVDLKTFLNARIAAIPALVTSLPVGPVDGQEVHFLADSTNGIVWHLRYRSASASTYKWEFVGGGSLRSTITTLSSFNLLTYTIAATPSIAAPLAGDYDITIEGVGSVGTANNALIVVPAIGGVTPAAGATEEQNGGAFFADTSTQGSSAARTSRRTATGATQTIQMAGRVVVSATGSLFYRTLIVTPVRVG